MFLVVIIPSFRYSDNSVHLHECSPFWVGIFITLKKENYLIYCFYVNMHILIDKNTEAFLYVIGKSTIM